MRPHPDNEVVAAMDGDSVVAHVGEVVTDQGGPLEGSAGVEAVCQGALQGPLPQTTAAHREWVGDHLVVDVRVAAARLLVDAKDCTQRIRSAKPVTVKVEDRNGENLCVHNDWTWLSRCKCWRCLSRQRCQKLHIGSETSHGSHIDTQKLRTFCQGASLQFVKQGQLWWKV